MLWFFSVYFSLTDARKLPFFVGQKRHPSSGKISRLRLRIPFIRAIRVP